MLSRSLPVSLNAILAACALVGLVFVAKLGTAGALVFLMAGGLLLVMSPSRIVPEITHYWALYLLPVFCCLSVFWSDYPDVTLRFGLQLGVTFAIAVAIGNRVSASALFVILLALYSAAMVASVGAGSVRSTGAWLGVFGSKNAFAAVAGTFVLLCTALFFACRISFAMRCIAFAGMIGGFILLVKSHSIGTIALTTVACAFAPVLLLLRGLAPIQRGTLIIFSTLLLLLSVMLINIYQSELSTFFLETTGKDATLTGRTELWASAYRLIAENPILGVGYQAFWVHGNAEAEALWSMFLIEQRSGFNFHNTYISNAVEIGILGVLVQVGLLVAALILSLVRAFARPDPSALFAAIFMMQLIMQSTVEVVAFFQFNIRTVIIIALVIHGLAEVRALRSKRAKATRLYAMPAV